MDTNINISTINKYFSRDIYEKQENTYRSVIINHSFFSVNEAVIVDKIKKIPYYSNYFAIIEDYEDLNVSQLNENIIERLKDAKNIKYYLFKYNDKNSVDFLDYLYNSRDIRKLILDNINIFQIILHSLHLLNENNICFFNISPKNIIFLEKSQENPIITNFRYSLRLNKIDYTYISNILNNIDDFTYQPLEIHLLYYFVKHDITTISYSFIIEFCDEFIESLHILNLFSIKYKESYKEECINAMKKYINLSKKVIIQDILERNDKWDVYGISMIFLHIFGCISRVFSLKGTFVSRITLELSKNLHPDSDKRMTLKDTIYMVHKLLNEQDDWNFIKTLDNNKLERLFDEISR